MKIAHIVSTYPPYYGGMGNVVFQTASELAKLGHEVEVFTPEFTGAGEVRPRTALQAATHGPEITAQINYARRLKPSLRYGNAARIPDVLTELHGFDVVHLHYPFFGTANLIRKWKLLHPKVPLIITYHMDTRAPGWKGLFFSYYARYFMPKILSVADAVVASSFDYLEGSQAAALFHSQKEKWVEIPFGVDTERFMPRPKPDDLMAGLSLSDEIPILLFVGGMDAAHYFKGVPVLLDAFRILKQSTAPVQAVLVGDGELRPSFEAQAEAFGLQDQVRFVGHVSDADLPAYYNLADLFVLPSTTRGEAFGMVLLEALASGVPVIATDLPGVRTVAAKAGSVVPPGDSRALAEAIGEFFSDPQTANLGGQAREAALKEYQWGLIAEALAGLYQTLLDTA